MQLLFKAQIKKTFIYISFSLGLIFLISGCGFQIRGHYQVPASFTEVVIQAPIKSSLADQLADALTNRNILTLRNKAAEMPIIEIVDEKLDRRILSLLATGQVAEYELVYKIELLFIDLAGAQQSQQIQLSREYQDDPNFALAKTREFELIIKEMQQDAVQRILLLINQYFTDKH